MLQCPFVRELTNLLRKTVSFHKVIYNLASSDIAAYLNELQEKVVIVPIYKTTINIALICKRFYAFVFLSIDSLQTATLVKKVKNLLQNLL